MTREPLEIVLARLRARSGRADVSLPNTQDMYLLDCQKQRADVDGVDPANMPSLRRYRTGKINS